MAGYSGTPLPKKLGIRPGHTVALVGAPAGFALEDLPEAVDVHRALVPACHVIVFFTTERAALEARFDALRAAMRPDCGLWIAWPKKAAKVPTDLTEDVVREIALARGLVDNKVCAISEVWSGLRLVVRLRDR